MVTRNADSLRCLFTLLVLTALSAGPFSPRKTAQAQEPRIPSPPVQQLEEVVRLQIRGAQEAVLSALGDPEFGPGERGEAFWGLGLIYHAYEFHDAAEESYRRAIELDPSRFEWKYCLAYLLQTTGRFEEALRLYHEAQALRPDFFLIALRIGETYRRLNLPEEAKQALESALRLNPVEPAIRARLGELAVDRKEYDIAVEMLESVLEMKPEVNRLHYPLAMAYRGLGKNSKARFHLALRGTVGLQPPDPLLTRLKRLAQGSRTLVLRGKQAYAAGRYGEAVTAFRKATEANPTDAGARINLGTALAREKEYDKAIVQIEEASRLAPENTTAHYNLGMIFTFLGRHEEAGGHLQTVLEREPGDAMARMVMAESLQGRRLFAKAFEEYKAAVRLDPTLTAGWIEMSSLLFMADQHRESRQVLEEAHERLPHEEAILQALAWSLSGSPDLSLRDGKRALDIARRLFNNAPRYNRASTVAMACAELNRCEEAVEWQTKALELAESRPAATVIVEKIKRVLEHYRQGIPCRVPGTGPEKGGD